MLRSWMLSANAPGGGHGRENVASLETACLIYPSESARLGCHAARIRVAMICTGTVSSALDLVNGPWCRGAAFCLSPRIMKRLT
jgi:hypothetical protein